LRQAGTRNRNHLREHSQRVLISQSPHDRSAITLDHLDISTARAGRHRPATSDDLATESPFPNAAADPHVRANATDWSKHKHITPLTARPKHMSMRRVDAGFALR
jgi:hypothetical protein